MGGVLGYNTGTRIITYAYMVAGPGQAGQMVIGTWSTTRDRGWVGPRKDGREGGLSNSLANFFLL